MRIIKSSGTKTWATGAGHAAQTFSIGNITGKLVEIAMQVSEVTGDPDVTLAVTDSNTVSIFNSGAKNDGTNYRFKTESNKVAMDADFDPAWFYKEAVTVSIDPSADAGGVAQTLTVTVDVYVEVP